MTAKANLGKMLNAVKLEFLSLPENVGLARVAAASVAAQLDLTLSEIEEIKVAVSEAVSNAVIHAYRPSGSGLVRLFITIYQHGLELVVEDQGCGIADVKKALQSGFSTEPERMGLGFVFMKSFMDHLEVTSPPEGGTVVRMVKRLDVSYSQAAATQN